MDTYEHTPTLAERRDEAAQGFAPYHNPSRYEAVSVTAQKAIDEYLATEDKLEAEAAK